MDVLAHALWAGAGAAWLRRRDLLSPRAAALTVGLALAPDVPHLLPVAAWTAFGGGTAATVGHYAQALPGQEPALPPMVEFIAHHLHCMTHSAVVAGVVTLLLWAVMRRPWLPLLGWWSHILIDVFTHSADYYPSPVLYPFTREGFDGVAWNAPWFLALNYAALAVTWLWLWRTRRAAGPP